jgi:hypothetical protein
MGHERGCQWQAWQAWRIRQYEAKGGSGFGSFLMFAVGIIVAFFAIKWGYTEY